MLGALSQRDIRCHRGLLGLQPMVRRKVRLLSHCRRFAISTGSRRISQERTPPPACRSQPGMRLLPCELLSLWKNLACPEVDGRPAGTD